MILIIFTGFDTVIVEIFFVGHFVNIKRLYYKAQSQIFARNVRKTRGFDILSSSMSLLRKLYRKMCIQNRKKCFKKYTCTLYFCNSVNRVKIYFINSLFLFYYPIDSFPK